MDALGLGAAVDGTAARESKSAGSRRASNSIGDRKPATDVKKTSEKTETAKTTVYVPRLVFEQWRELAFTERKKMHDYLLEGLDRVFADRGLKSIAELKSKE